MNEKNNANAILLILALKASISLGRNNKEKLLFMERPFLLRSVLSGVKDKKKSLMLKLLKIFRPDIT